MILLLAGGCAAFALPARAQDFIVDYQLISETTSTLSSPDFSVEGGITSVEGNHTSRFPGEAGTDGQVAENSAPTGGGAVQESATSDVVQGGRRRDAQTATHGTSPQETQSPEPTAETEQNQRVAVVTEVLPLPSGNTVIRAEQPAPAPRPRSPRTYVSEPLPQNVASVTDPPDRNVPTDPPVTMLASVSGFLASLLTSGAIGRTEFLAIAVLCVAGLLVLRFRFRSAPRKKNIKTAGRLRAPMRQRRGMRAAAVLLAVMIGGSQARAAGTPHTLFYEGRITNSERQPITQPVTLRFSLWSAADWTAADTASGAVNTGSSAYGGWVESQTVTPTSDGIVRVQMGGGTPLPIMDTVRQRFLQVEMKMADTPDVSFQLLDPTGDAGADAVDRQLIGASAFAINAETVQKRTPGTASGNLLVLNSDNRVDAERMGSGTVLRDFTINANREPGDVTLTFGNAAHAAILRFNAAQERFEFSGDVHVTGTLQATVTVSAPTVHAAELLTSSGALRASGSLLTNADLTLNGDQGENDAILTFGNATQPQTLKFTHATQRFELSADLRVAGGLTASGALSGTALTITGLQSCSNGLVTDASGAVACGAATAGAGDAVTISLINHYTALEETTASDAAWLIPGETKYGRTAHYIDAARLGTPTAATLVVVYTNTATSGTNQIGLSLAASPLNADTVAVPLSSSQTTLANSSAYPQVIVRDLSVDELWATAAWAQIALKLANKNTGPIIYSADLILYY